MTKTAREVIAGTMVRGPAVEVGMDGDRAFGLPNASAIITALETAGFVIVPKEPSQKMLDRAFYDYMGYERQGPNKPPWNGRTMWCTMINEALR